MMPRVLPILLAFVFWLSFFGMVVNRNLISCFPADPVQTIMEMDSLTPPATPQLGSSNHFIKFDKPKIVWLMSFPNSGTSFTLMNTRKVTNRTFATNYGQEPMLPIYPFNQGGPFWRTGIAPLPTKYVLTKTHCSSYAVDTGPKVYIETVENFVRRCAVGSYRSNRQWIVSYPPQLVQKAVHLVRNPHDNIVSRFHHKFKDSSFSEMYPKNATGFQSWCKDMDARDAQQDEIVFGNNTSLYKALKNLPCHSDFYRHVQWHNLAFEAKALLDIPSHIIHYEEYEKDFSSTVANLLKFLEATPQGAALDFSPGHSYHSFYSKKQRLAIRVLVKKLASQETWKQLDRYF